MRALLNPDVYKRQALIKRIMPNSLEAEQSVVGSMIMSKDAIVTDSEMLLKEDFYHQQYGIIFETMVELFTEAVSYTHLDVYKRQASIQ